jgi:hypothetical protein
MRGCSDLRSACGAPPVKSRGEGLVPEQYQSLIVRVTAILASSVQSSDQGLLVCLSYLVMSIRELSDQNTPEFGSPSYSSTLKLLPLHQHAIHDPAQQSSTQAELLYSGPTLNIYRAHLSFTLFPLQTKEPQQHRRKDQNSRSSRTISEYQIRIPKLCIRTRWHQDSQTIPQTQQTTPRRRDQTLVYLSRSPDFHDPISALLFSNLFLLEFFGKGG